MAKPVTPADIATAITQAMGHCTNEQNNASGPAEAGMLMLIEDALAELSKNPEAMAMLAERYSCPGVVELFREYLEEG
jgi:hypothetical protein